MGITRRSASAGTDLITLAAEGDRCDVCHSDAEVATVNGVDGGYDNQDGGYLHTMNVCTTCAAVLIEVVSGFKARRTVASWYAVRDNARNIRLTDK